MVVVMVVVYMAMAWRPPTCLCVSFTQRPQAWRLSVRASAHRTWPAISIDTVRAVAVHAHLL